MRFVRHLRPRMADNGRVGMGTRRLGAKLRTISGFSRRSRDACASREESPILEGRSPMGGNRADIVVTSVAKGAGTDHWEGSDERREVDSGRALGVRRAA